MILALREHYARTGRVAESARAVGIDRKTARRYLRLNALPSELPSWPFPHVEEAWAIFQNRPGLTTNQLLAILEQRHPGSYEPKHVRALRDRLTRWRAALGIRA